MDGCAGGALAGATGEFACTEISPALVQPADASLCVTCQVRSQCIGDVAAHAGTRQLLAALGDRRLLRAGEAMQLPAAGVLAVRSGSLKSLAPLDCAPRPLGFHFPGEAVGAGRQGVRLVAMEDAQLCVMRAGAAGGASPSLGRLWDMMSRELVRERALALLLARLPPGQRVAEFLADLAVRAHASRSRFPQLSAADVAGHLGLPLAEVEGDGGVR